MCAFEKRFLFHWANMATKRSLSVPRAFISAEGCRLSLANITQQVNPLVNPLVQQRGLQCH